MDLTVLGASPATQNPGGACSSYLVREGETTLVLDMGSGAFAQLQRHAAPEHVDAIVISHMHADHTLDLIPYRYFLFFQEQKPERKPRLLFPPGGHRTMLRVSGMQDLSESFFSAVFDVDEYDPARPLRAGPLSIAFHAVQHIPHTYGMRVEGRGLLAYSADSGPCLALVDVARGADLFICESANKDESQPPIHLTPRQAGEYARDGGARRLLLTHRWHLYGLDLALREAAAAFDGPVSMAREGETYGIGD